MQLLAPEQVRMACTPPSLRGLGTFLPTGAGANWLPQPSGKAVDQMEMQLVLDHDKASAAAPDPPRSAEGQAVPLEAARSRQSSQGRTRREWAYSECGC